MESKELSLRISDIINNEKLKGSLYSTLKCSICGKKLIVQALHTKLRFVCAERRARICPPGEKEHDDIELNLTEIAAMMNFNPLL